MTNPVQVTQADREAAAALLDKIGGIQRFEKFGISFAALNNAFCGAFARHRHDRIAELEAAVTRLTLALEMERGRGQPRTALTERECGVCKGSGKVDSSLQPDGKKTCPCCGGSGSRSEAAEHDRSFPDLGPSKTDEVVMDGIIRWIDEVIERADSHGHTEGLWLFASQWRRVRAALTPARTYEQGIEDAAKVAYAASIDDQRKEQQYRDSASAADSTGGRDVDLEYAVSYARRASRSREIAEAICALGTKP